MTQTDSDVVRVDGGGGGLDRFFKISERGSTVRIEIVAGITTWLTMAYILFVNPAILGFVGDPRPAAARAAVRAGAHRDGARRRGDDDPDGRRRELPVRARGRPGAQRLRRVHARRGDTGSRSRRRWA